MIDIHEQKEFKLLEETKDIVITNNVENQLVKELEEVLGTELKNLSTEPFTTIFTLGKLKSKRVHVVNYEALNSKDKRQGIYKKIAGLKDNVCVLIDTFQNDDYKYICQDLSEKILTENYTFNDYKSKSKEEDKNFYYYGETKIYNYVKKGYVYGEAINTCKDLVNTPYNYMNATDLADFAKDLERFENVTVEIFNKPEIEKMKMGAFLGVNQGSIDEPKLILVKYQGKKEWKNPTALVGKGVMYDTGGYSLKTPMQN